MPALSVLVTHRTILILLGTYCKANEARSHGVLPKAARGSDFRRGSELEGFLQLGDAFVTVCSVRMHKPAPPRGYQKFTFPVLSCLPGDLTVLPTVGFSKHCTSVHI